MPDGTPTRQEPPSPAEEINSEIAASQAFGWVLELFGGEWESGGGGEGQFMFASLDELDSVIGAWKDEIAAMEDDRRRIEDLNDIIDRPAADPMSGMHAKTTQGSIQVLRKHTDEMLRYANDYLMKLTKAREQMALTEDGVRTNMNNTYT